jgi:hypothetical protein
MRDIPREAAELRESLRLGLRSVAEAVAWADAVIGESEHPAMTFIELASMQNAHPLDVLSVLSRLSESIPTVDVLPSVLGLAYHRLGADPRRGRRFARALYSIYADECSCEVPPALEEISWFDDAFDLAAEGVVRESPNFVQQQLLSFCKRFDTSGQQ